VSLQRKIAQREKRRSQRVRKKLKHSDLPRVSVFKSAKHIYGQIIDDLKKTTLVSFSTLQMKSNVAGDKTEVAHQIGLELAKRALKQGINQVAFDRGSFLYHGRVKAFAEGMREGGINI
jgi:large subunit ribosomal protein L18